MKDDDSNLPAVASPHPGRVHPGLFADQGGVRGIFSSKVTDYLASRPDYPAALYDALRDEGALPGVPSVVADIGAGTGLFSAGLLARGHSVVAVDPNAAMGRRRRSFYKPSKATGASMDSPKRRPSGLIRSI